MNKFNYLSDPYLQNFISWLEDRIDTHNSLIHKYEILKTKKKWKCNSIFNAFENYEWSFKYLDSVDNAKVSGNTFEESCIYMDKLSIGLRESVDSKNEELCHFYCLAILEWGGRRVFNGNKSKIEELYLENRLTKYFEKMKSFLNPKTFDTTHLNNTKDIGKFYMNSGFTKIYSLLLNDFIIYDGRVGAALGLLVRQFCIENEIPHIPSSLLFAYGDAGKTKSATGLNRRDPSCELYQFQNLRSNSDRHIENNQKANWLLREVLNNSKSKFKDLEEKRQLRAFEAALFMIGYDVKVKVKYNF